jgi:hypothetical protein
MKKKGSHKCRAAQNGLVILHQVHKAKKLTSQQQGKDKKIENI